MKCFLNLLAALVFLFSFATGHSQTIIDVKRDFGAVGNGKADDTKAFLQAVERVNRIKNNVVLIIPKGTYRVRPQKTDDNINAAAYSAVHILSFSSCSNITVKGEKGTKIQFSGPLYYGAFRRGSRGPEKLGNKTTDYRYRVAVGHGILLENCSGVTIQQLEIDGNNKSFILGNEFGDVGIQIDNDGAFVKDCSRVNFFDLKLHHFGRDGILVINKTPQGFTTLSQDIILSNCQFEYNGRQGLSWAGGVGLTATNCSFSNTGKSKVGSPPGAGIDFEPNAGYIVKEGLFVNCVVTSNAGVAVIADVAGFDVRNIKFVNSTLSGQTSHALWVKSPAFTFVNCAINGGFLFGCPATTPEEGTRFIGCTFDDRLSAGAPSNFLVESNGSRFLFFDNCVFRASAKGFFYVAADASVPAQRAVFKDCRFIVVNSPLLKKRSNRGSLSTGADFTGHTVTIDSSGMREGWNIASSRFIGTKGAKNMFEITHNFLLASFEEVVLGDGRENVQMTVAQNGALLINHSAKLTINKKGTLLLKKGGTLWVAPGAQLIIEGELVAEAGAFLCINNQAVFPEAAKRNVKIAGKANFTDNTTLKLGLSGCITIPDR
jgi:hypothetical protein